MHSFTMNAGITLHLRKLAGTNSHHVAEACFKGLGRALREAVSMDERFKDSVLSTKGVL
jgi:imidazoleglycerol-phosphate dehydratase